MNSIHIIELPKKIIVGHNIITKIPLYLKDLDIPRESTIAVITGPTVYNIVGKKVIDILEDSGYNIYHWIIEKPLKSIVDELIDESIDVDAFIGIGGGKSIDAAKYLAAKKSKIFISVPTAASHDGISSPFASLKGFNKPTSIKAVPPTVIVADINVISRAPPRLLKAGVGDLVGKLTAVKDWQLAHRLRGEYYGEYAAQLALLSAKHVLRYPELIASCNPEGVRIVVEALISSGVAMCIAGSSRPASGSEHLFSHALDLIAPKPALHGEQVAIGTIMMLYLYGDPRWRRVKNTLKKIGLPVTAKELGIPDEVIIDALTIAHKIRHELPGLLSNLLSTSITST